MKARKKKIEMSDILDNNPDNRFGFIVRIVATDTEFNVEPEEILSYLRAQPVALARQVVWYFLRREFRFWGYNYIGKRFGLTHSTVISGIKNVKNKMETDPDFAALIERIKTKIESERK